MAALFFKAMVSPPTASEACLREMFLWKHFVLCLTFTVYIIVLYIVYITVLYITVYILLCIFTVYIHYIL